MVTDLLKQDIVIYNKTATDKFGSNLYGGGTTVKSRFQRTRKNIMLPNRETMTIEAIVYIPADTTVSIGDRVAYGSTNYEVYGVYDAIDGNGSTNHIRLELKKWLG